MIGYVAPAFPNPINPFQYNEVLRFAELGGVSVFPAHPLAGEAWDHRSLRARELLAWKLRGRRKVGPGGPVDHHHATDRTPLRLPSAVVTSPRRWLKDRYVRILAGSYSHLARRVGVMHIHADFAGTPGLLAALMSDRIGVPFSVKLHANDIFPRDLEQAHPHLESVLERAALIVAEHAYGARVLKERFPRLEQREILVNRTGVDVTQYRYVPRHWDTQDRPFELVSVGRLVPKKGHDSLVRACALLKKQGVSLRCRIVGYGPQADQLRDLIACSGLTGTVVLTGRMAPPEVQQVLSESDGFALLCTTAPDGDMDGIPTSILEAMAVGLPVVTTPTSGIPEAVHNEKNGLVVPADDPEAAAVALARLMTEPRLGTRLASAARVTVEERFNHLTNATRLWGALVECSGWSAATSVRR